MPMQYTILKGTPYLSDVGVNAFESLGNCATMTVTQEIEQVSVPDNENPGGGTAAAQDRIKSMKVSLACRQVSVALLEIALGATVSTVASAAVVDEVQSVVALDKLIVTDTQMDPSVAPVVKNAAGSTTYVKDIDYTVKRSGIVPKSGGAITVGTSNLKISYTKVAGKNVQALLAATKKKALLFDGFNENNSSSPFLGKFHNVSWGPAKNLSLIGSDFATFEIEGTVLPDDTKNGTTVSKYVELRVGGL